MCHQLPVCVHQLPVLNLRTPRAISTTNNEVPRTPRPEPNYFKFNSQIGVTRNSTRDLFIWMRTLASKMQIEVVN